MPEVSSEPHNMSLSGIPDLESESNQTPRFQIISVDERRLPGPSILTGKNAVSFADTDFEPSIIYYILLGLSLSLITERLVCKIKI